MISTLKKKLFKHLSFENYLRLHQKGFFFLYNMSLLKFSESYKYHYYIKRLINKGDVVIDIGANLGYYSVLFAKQTGTTGKVYSVEPIKVFNNIFNEVAGKYNNITLYPFALGTEEKVIQLVSNPNIGYFRTGLPHVYDSARDGDMKNIEFSFDAQMKIPSKLFEPLDRINYIKCDIEGLEYEVLSNMKEIIRKHKPKVQVEVWGQNEKLITELFDDMGYIPYKVSKNKMVSLKSTCLKIEGDYIFVHKDQIGDIA